MQNFCNPHHVSSNPIQSAVSEWGAFDDKLNITEQVKRLIVRELESQLIKARG